MAEKFRVNEAAVSAGPATELGLELLPEPEDDELLPQAAAATPAASTIDRVIHLLVTRFKMIHLAC